MDFNEISAVADKLSTTMLFMLILYGGFKRWWVFGHTYRDMVTDRDQWRDLALSGTNLAEQAVKVASDDRS